jgi:hypothetical protein
MSRSRLLILCLSCALLVCVVLPAHAEYAWNPFENMTDKQAGSVFMTLVLFIVVGFLLGFVFIPVLFGCLTYLLLSWSHPAAFIKIRPVLFQACLMTWAVAVLLVVAFYFLPYLRFIPYSPVSLLYLGSLMQLAAPVIGATRSYFTQASLYQTEALPSETDALA